MLNVKGLKVFVEGKKILNGVDLEVRPGEVEVIMGPNGSGKSTLAYTLAGHPNYKCQMPNDKSNLKSKTQMTLDGKDLLSMSPDQRARRGLFLAFQYPVAIGGVTVEQLLRAAVQNSNPLSALEFRKILFREAERLEIKADLLKRSLNEGFSGGEKKRVEILQAIILKPKYAILDETDSGLDVDAMRTIARGIRSLADLKTGILVITHYARLLKYLQPEGIHIMKKGKIVRSGGKKLAEIIEKEGYGGN